MKKVFVNGTFDVLHAGHLALLNYAKSLGDYLVVGIDTDERVKEKKGPTRPVNSVEDRTLMLMNLKSVDEVKHFGTDEELENLVKSVQPDIMVVGSDWKDKSVIGSYYASNLIFFDRIDEYSSTKIIQSIIDRG
jgi:D-beta-D-heptose 7-phosphate kinase/D-beta-D-heptose 1-phosphate adenosyltransferase